MNRTRTITTAAAAAWVAAAATTFPLAAQAQGPSFDCRQARTGSAERAICDDAALSALDRQLADVYAQARAKARNEHPPRLAAEQRGWIKGRDDCWKSDDARRCMAEAYRLRIAELQARYRLVEFVGPVRYACGDAAGSEVVATFFRTEPPTLVAERGDQVSFMVLQPSGSGARYQGRNESLWEHHGEARVSWGPGAAEITCRRTP